MVSYILRVHATKVSRNHGFNKINSIECKLDQPKVGDLGSHVFIEEDIGSVEIIVNED